MHVHATLDIANLAAAYPLPPKMATVSAASQTLKDEKRYLAALNQQLLAHPSSGLGLYIHIPFCAWHCAYCTNDKIIQHPADQGLQYVHYLQRELALYAEFFLYPPKLAWLHFGGGNPAMLSEAALFYLMQCLHHSFQFAPDAHWCFEVDPRTVTRQQLVFLRGLGFNQLRFEGLDLHAAVQSAVKRQQSWQQVQSMVDEARALGFAEMDMHMMVGLPKQQLKRLTRTIKQCVCLNPDSITLTSFVHQPTQFSAQKAIVRTDLPDAEALNQMLQALTAQLLAAGYQQYNVSTGVQTTLFFMRAMYKQQSAEGSLQPQALQPTNLLALGVSAISKMGDCFRQNSRTLYSYYQSLDQQRLPIDRCDAR